MLRLFKRVAWMGVLAAGLPSALARTWQAIGLSCAAGDPGMTPGRGGHPATHGCAAALRRDGWHHLW